ncbi:MAG: ribosome maturation factor RimM, partial [Acidimicrobiales bacterium]
MVRSHGLAGAVIVTLVTNRPERLDPGALLWGDGGRELRVEQASPHQDRWLVHFAGVAGRGEADRLRGTVLRAEALADPG